MRTLTPAQVRSLLEDPIGPPLANGPGRGKTSLGGVQPKAVLVKTKDGWAQVLGGYPSTHILKPHQDEPKSTLSYDEGYGSRLARRLGLAAFDTGIEDFDGHPAIVIDRYDPTGGRRVDQENFSQVLGVRLPAGNPAVVRRQPPLRQPGGRCRIAWRGVPLRCRLRLLHPVQ